MKLSLILGALALVAWSSPLAVVFAIAFATTAVGAAYAAPRSARMSLGKRRADRSPWRRVGPTVLRSITAALALALFGLIAPAWAQTAAVPVPGFMVSTVLPVLLPVALTVGGIFVPVIGSLIWARIVPALDAFQQLSGVQIDAGHREALHSAIDTGLKLAFAKGAPALEATLAGHLAAGRVGEVSEWVTKSVPGAIAHLGVSREILDGLTTARLSDSLLSTAGSAIALPGAILSGLAGTIAPAGTPSCPVCGTTDPNAVCTRADCPDAQPAPPAGG